MADADERKRRAEERRRRAGLHKTTVKGVGADLHPVRGAEAVELAIRLTLESWAMAGREYPRYSRAETPYRFVPSASQKAPAKVP